MSHSPDRCLPYGDGDGHRDGARCVREGQIANNWNQTRHTQGSWASGTASRAPQHCAHTLCAHSSPTALAQLHCSPKGTWTPCARPAPGHPVQGQHKLAHRWRSQPQARSAARAGQLTHNLAEVASQRACWAAQPFEGSQLHACCAINRHEWKLDGSPETQRLPTESSAGLAAAGWGPRCWAVRLPPAGCV